VNNDVVRRLVLGTVVIVALVLLGVGFSIVAKPEDNAVSITKSAVEQVEPASGDLDLRQARIGADLDTGYTGVLLLDGVEIPEDQLERIDPLNQVFYTPGPEKETGALRPGRHQATVVFWPIGKTREQGTDSYTWFFNVH
jgi:hypothetical protein